MPGAFTNKEIAAAAGRKSKPGKHAKTKQWEALGDLITNELTGEVMVYVRTLEPKDMLDVYLKLLEYFKPRLSRAEVRAEFSPLSDKIQTVYDAIQQEPDLPTPDAS